MSLRSAALNSSFIFSVDTLLVHKHTVGVRLNIRTQPEHFPIKCSKDPFPEQLLITALAGIASAKLILTVLPGDEWPII